jgi:hypothetical protein
MEILIYIIGLFCHWLKCNHLQGLKNIDWIKNLLEGSLRDMTLNTQLICNNESSVIGQIVNSNVIGPSLKV